MSDFGRCMRLREVAVCARMHTLPVVPLGTLRVRAFHNPALPGLRATRPHAPRPPVLLLQALYYSHPTATFFNVLAALPFHRLLLALAPPHHLSLPLSLPLPLLSLRFSSIPLHPLSSLARPSPPCVCPPRPLVLLASFRPFRSPQPAFPFACRLTAFLSSICLSSFPFASFNFSTFHTCTSLRLSTLPVQRRANLVIRPDLPPFLAASTISTVCVLLFSYRCTNNPCVSQPYNFYRTSCLSLTCLTASHLHPPTPVHLLHKARPATPERQPVSKSPSVSCPNSPSRFALVLPLLSSPASLIGSKSCPSLPPPVLCFNRCAFRSCTDDVGH